MSWQPNYSEEYRKYLKSPEWKAKRKWLFKVRGRKCEKCDNRSRLEVHHLTYANIGKETLADLQVLCAHCHYIEHFGAPRPPKPTPALVRVKKLPYIGGRMRWKSPNTSALKLFDPSDKNRLRRAGLKQTNPK